MRIACLHLPSLHLQAHVRQRPQLAGTAFVVVSTDEHPKVLACSRTAFENGVRVGMSAAQLHEYKDLQILSSHPALCQRTVEAMAEALLALSETVDLVQQPADCIHKRIYLHVPNGVRGEAFGNKILTVVSRQGLRGRVGIADDRFTAWVAATGVQSGEEIAPHNTPCVTVPRGGSAVFLSSLPIALLPIDDSMITVLRTLGIHTIGQAATLPPPSLSRRWHNRTNFQKLARGDGPTKLRAFTPTNAITERIELEHPIAGVEPLSFFLRPLCERISARLHGRSTGARQAAVHLLDANGAPLVTIELAPDQPTASSRALRDLVHNQLSNTKLGNVAHYIAAIELTVVREDTPPNEENRTLFSPAPGGEISEFTTLNRGPHWRTRRGKHRPRVRRPTGRHNTM